MSFRWVGYGVVVSISVSSVIAGCSACREESLKHFLTHERLMGISLKTFLVRDLPWLK